MPCDPTTGYCSVGLLSSTCVALVATGQPCPITTVIGPPSNGPPSGPSVCVPNDLCLPVEDGDAGSCQPSATVGQPCVLLPNEPIGPGLSGSNCASGLGCIAGSCASLPVSAGAACQGNGNDCGANLYCTGDVDGGLGVCQAPGSVNQACSTPNSCTSPLYCLAGTCQALPANGQPCLALPGSGPSTTGQCIGGDYCNSQGQCALIGSVGAACDPLVSNSCLDSYCATGACAALLPPGSACNPSQVTCQGGYETCTISTLPDGGVLIPADGGPPPYICTDSSCVADGGSPICVTGPAPCK